MNKLTKIVILSSALLALGCVSDTTPDDGSNQERARCGAKCDEAISSLKVLKGLTLVAEDGKFGLTAETIGELDEEVWVDIEVNGDIVYTEMYPSDDGSTYNTRRAFELPAYDKLAVVAFGYLGETQYEQKFTFEGDVLEGKEADHSSNSADPFEAAYDVEAAVITIPKDAEVPTYESAQVAGVLGLGGTEFWQKWDGGLNPTYSYGEGSDAGRKCMYASARRFEAVMNDPPQSILTLADTSNWSGRFFNWNDDFSPENAQGAARGSTLWAWRTSLVKWMSQTGTNGKCYLPTKSMVDRFAKIAIEKASAEDGEIEGAQSN